MSRSPRAMLAPLALLGVSLIAGAFLVVLLDRHLALDLPGRLARLRSKLAGAGAGIQDAQAIAYAYDVRCGWKLMPHTQIHWVRPGRYDVRVRTNGDGFVDREHMVRTAFYRIAFVGDSFTEAQQVDVGQRFTDLTEDYVFQLSGGKKAVETMNFGVSNWGTAHEYGAIKHFVLKYHPDEIWIMFFAGNDLGDNSPLLNPPPMGPTYVYAPGSEEELSDIVFGYPEPPAVMNARRTARYGEEWLSTVHQRWDTEVFPYFFSEAHDALMDEMLQDTRKAFRLIRDTVRRDNVVLRVVYIFSGYELKKEMWTRFAAEARRKRNIDLDPAVGEEKIRSMVQGLGIDFISLSPLKQYGEGIFGDHFTAEGHRRVADFLARGILQKCPVPDLSPPAR